MKSEITKEKDTLKETHLEQSAKKSAKKNAEYAEQKVANAYIALGSNLNEPLLQLQRAYQAIDEKIGIVAASSIYKTAPVGGPEGQDAYLNAVIGIDTELSAQKLLSVLHIIEAEQGRERKVRWDARTLDLDLLVYKQLVLDTKRLQLPHPRMMERAFVLVPFCEIVDVDRLCEPWVHPVSQQTAQEALKTLDSSDIEKTDFLWN